MIVETCSCLTAIYHALSSTIMSYHQLSVTLNMFKIVMIVDDSFSHLTAHTIVHNSYGKNELAHYHRLSCAI